MPQAQFGPVKIPDGTPDEQFLFLSDVLPTAWQAVVYADVPPGGSVAVLGLGPIGQMAVRIAGHARCRPSHRCGFRARNGLRWRSDTASRPLDLGGVDDVSAALIEMVDGRGPDSTIDAVGMEAHGTTRPAANKLISLAQKATGFLPDPIAQKVTDAPLSIASTPYSPP